MLAYYGTEISKHMTDTPEGYLICRDVPIARTGEMTYRAAELQLEFYTVTQEDGTALERVHHSRIIRFTGRKLPYFRRVTEQYWGASEVEALYREVVKYDNTTANMAALTFRANVDTMKVKNLEQLFSIASGEQQRRFWNTMQAQSVLKSNFGTQLVDPHPHDQALRTRPGGDERHRGERPAKLLRLRGHPAGERPGPHPAPPAAGAPGLSWPRTSG